jgi:hypothetical protein
MTNLSKLFELQSILATVLEKADELRNIEQDTLDTSVVAFELEKEVSIAMNIVQRRINQRMDQVKKATE